MKQTDRHRVCGPQGFTLVELQVASAISIIILSVSLAVFIFCMKTWKALDSRLQADREVNLAVSSMTYGMGGGRLGIRSATSVVIVTNGMSGGWTLTYGVIGEHPQTNTFTYSPVASNLVLNPGSIVVGKDISYANVVIGSQILAVTMRVDRADGFIKVQRQAATSIAWRN